MRYQGSLYRPPSEAHSLIIQATLGCSWNACTYCEMYRDKTFSVRPLPDLREDLERAQQMLGSDVKKIFVADGDALAMDMHHWQGLLDACHRYFPKVNRVSCYGTAMNLLAKRAEDLRTLRELGLSLIYIGPESGDDLTLKQIAKGANAQEHVKAASQAHAAGMDLSAIFLLGIGGVERSQAHAQASAKLITQMDPKYFSLLTLTVIPGSPLAKQASRGKFTLPSIEQLLEEMQTIIRETQPTNAVFRTNHASNYLPLQGRLPRDREKLLDVLQQALSGKISLRPEWARGL